MHLRRALSTTLTVLKKMNSSAESVHNLILPPVNQSMQVLDRSFFQKIVHLSAASIPDVQNISTVRTALTKSKELFQYGKIRPVHDDPDDPKMKCILLVPNVNASDPSTWSSALTDLVDKNQVRVREYQLKLTYDDWSTHDILEAILPDIPEDEKETPAGFAQAGHVAHVNLRAPYLPYKTLIGQVLMDKNPQIKTVINKTFDVGTESVFRTFPYEVLAGEDDLDVTVNESGCEFKFNFGKVYWNSRLGTEHARVFRQFKEGQAVCDVMAGVGPFAIPAGKARVFVHANDLNPASYDGLEYAIKKNKVERFVSASCRDGRAFIRSATRSLPHGRRSISVKPKVSIPRTASASDRKAAEIKIKRETIRLTEPASFDHYIMNLPASAVEFLDAFKGVYAGRESEFIPHTERKLPMIHVYLFQTRFDNEREEEQDICDRISKYLGTEIGPHDPKHELELYYVRLVAPKKKMYCASFRLPAEVAFARS